MKGLRAVVSVLALGLLTACASPAPQPTTTSYPVIQPTAGDVLKLDVAEIQIVKAYAPPRVAPHIEHLLPFDLSDMVANWALDRLKAVGTTGTARVVILNASMREAIRRTESGAMSFKRNRLYEGALQVRVDVTDPQTQRAGFAKGAAASSRMVAVKISKAKRNRVWNEMTREMLNGLDASLEPDIKRGLRRLVRY